MPGRLGKEIKMTRPFRSLEEEAYLNLLRTAEALRQGIAEVLRAHSLSPAQYNVLRILRGAGAGGLACREIGERMVTRDPDITRLLDRLEDRKLVTRARDPRDRRIIVTRITMAGLKTLRALDRPVARAHLDQLGHLGKRSLQAMIELLERAREAREGAAAPGGEI